MRTQLQNVMDPADTSVLEIGQIWKLGTFNWGRTFWHSAARSVYSLGLGQIGRAQSKLVTNRSDIPHLGKGSCGPFLGRIYQQGGRQKVSWAGFWAKYLNLSPEPPCFPYLGKHPTSPNSCKVVWPKVHFSFSTLIDVESAWDEMVTSSNWL